MNKRTLLLAVGVAVAVLLFAGIAAAGLSSAAAPSPQVETVASLGLPAIAGVSARPTAVPSAVDTATALSIAQQAAGLSIVSEAASTTVEHVVLASAGAALTASASGTSAWMVTYHGLTLGPMGPAGRPQKSYSGMNHTEIIDANTGEVIKAMEYMPKP